MQPYNHNVECEHRGNLCGTAKCPGCGGKSTVYRCAANENGKGYCIVEIFSKPLAVLTIDGQDMGNVSLSEIPICRRCTFIANPAPKPVPTEPVPSKRTFRDLLLSLPGQVTFLDVGANDGVFQNEFRDLAIQRGWGGIMVEPVEANFRQLAGSVEPYPKIKAVQAAITERSGTAEIRVPSQSSPQWVSGSCTLSRIDRELCRDSEHWHDETVPTMRLDEVLQGTETLDAVCIDAEGSDWVVFNQLDLAKYRPKAIKIEVAHLSKQDRQKIVSKLDEAGYVHWIIENFDIVATPSEVLHPHVDIVVPCMLLDKSRFELLDASLKKFSSIEGDKYLIVPPDQISDFGKFAPDWTVVNERSLVPAPRGSGWFIQQSLKLAASELVKTPFYLVLDADCFAVAPVSHTDLVVDGKGIVQYRKPHLLNMEGLGQGQIDRRLARIERRKLHKADSSQSQPWYRVPAELLGCAMANGALNVTPFVVNVEIVKSVKERLKALHGWENPWMELLHHIGQGGNWTEFTLYQTWASHTGMLWALHIDAVDANVRPLNDHCVWTLTEKDNWSPEVAFSGAQLFSLVQSRARIPASWTMSKIGGRFK